ncbi:glycosyltransferase family 4 protein [Alkalinema sp. FACHB-956]|uniref:glycosyltransferase family 4 protein n=1 Tax=Alkalinema sp. FACHB-956 TaxID=2692768 RepID=UPI001683E0B5|nr:glycosyltransferase family 4 protein [Alkalinema sp. FACHB-956]MBD2325687.1 glycosyltransferase family 4 protein [Alkalinema sp. FACHB-956]
MHILVLEKEPTSRRGGQERSLFEVSRQLHQRGHRISLLYTQSGDLLSQYQAFCQQTLSITALSFSRHRPLQTFLNLPRDLNRAKALIHPNEPTLIYTNQIYDIPFAGLLSQLTRLPLVCHLRLPAPDKLDLQRSHYLSAVHKFITVSQHTKQTWLQKPWVQSLGHPPIEVVYNSIDTEYFTPASNQNPHPRQQLQQQWNLPTDHTLLAYAGRLDRRKGLENLLHGFAKFNATQPKSTLLIAGKPLLDRPDYLKELQVLTQTLNIQANVRFLGHLTETRSLYQASDLVIMPSIWPEPFGRVIIEAMACGTPVIASHTGGIPEILTGEFAQTLFPPRNPAALADRIQQVLTWKQTDPLLSQRCRQHVQTHFSLTTNIAEIEGIFQQTLSPQKLLAPPLPLSL